MPLLQTDAFYKDCMRYTNTILNVLDILQNLVADTTASLDQFYALSELKFCLFCLENSLNSWIDEKHLKTGFQVMPQILNLILVSSGCVFSFSFLLRSCLASGFVQSLIGFFIIAVLNLIVCCVHWSLWSWLLIMFSNKPSQRSCTLHWDIILECVRLIRILFDTITLKVYSYKTISNYIYIFWGKSIFVSIHQTNNYMCLCVKLSHKI